MSVSLSKFGKEILLAQIDNDVTLTFRAETKNQADSLYYLLDRSLRDGNLNLVLGGKPNSVEKLL